MLKNSIIKYAMANALWTVIYVILVATFMFNGEHIFGGQKSILIPVAMILLFVFSALVTGSLVLGRPIVWYMDGRKKEALKLLAYTTGIILVVIILLLIVAYVLNASL